MTDGSDIDWRGLGARDPVDDYGRAFQTARALARPPPTGGPPPPAPPAPSLEAAHGRIASLPDAQRQAAVRSLIAIDQIAQAIGARTPDPNERARMARHFAMTHPDLGVDPSLLSPDGMTDPQIAALHASVAEAVMRVKQRELAEAQGGPPRPGQPPPPARTGAEHLTDDQLKTALGL